MIPADALPLAALALVLWIEAGRANLAGMRAGVPVCDPDRIVLDRPGTARLAGLAIYFAFWPVILLVAAFMARGLRQ